MAQVCTLLKYTVLVIINRYAYLLYTVYIKISMNCAAFVCEPAAVDAPEIQLQLRQRLSLLTEEQKVQHCYGTTLSSFTLKHHWNLFRRKMAFYKRQQPQTSILYLHCLSYAGAPVVANCSYHNCKHNLDNFLLDDTLFAFWQQRHEKRMWNKP